MTIKREKRPDVQMPEQDKLLALAKRCLFLAYVWNDHNFADAHIEAREQAQRLGINNLEMANEFLGRVCGL